MKSYQEKISKWQGQVSERLGVLSQRGGSIYYSSIIYVFLFTHMNFKIEIYFLYCCFFPFISGGISTNKVWTALIKCKFITFYPSLAMWVKLVTLDFFIVTLDVFSRPHLLGT